jgi:energy-coupling factor transport system ATP-binding protein
MNYIDIKDLSFKYPEEDKEALSNISISIKKGEFLLVAGKSGSGKSTFGKTISGVIPSFYGGAIRGKVLVKDMRLSDIPQYERASEITMVFQDPERQLMMNKVHREIAFGLENIGVDPEEINRRVWESLQFINAVDLAYKDIDSLSGGQKQKLAIASAIAYLPSCIVFDEPTSQLDPSVADEVAQLIKKINEELGITVILIEQRLDRWFEMTDRVLILDSGKQAFCGSKEEFYNLGKFEDFLPAYLKIAKQIKMEALPMSFKEMKMNLADLKYTSENNYFEEAINSEIITASKLTVRYDNLMVLKGINFNIYKGDFIGIIGANGAGKSTLLKTISGLKDYCGNLKLRGSEISKIRLRELSKVMGYVSQNPSDYISKETVYEEVEFTLKNHGIADKNAIEDVLKKLNIYELRNKNPRDLSGGEKQRVAIASVMVTKPAVLLLDEPTRGLDAEMKNTLKETLLALKAEGVTLIMVTHDIDFAAEVCGKFMLMIKGELISFGSHKKVFENGIYYTTTVHKIFKDIDRGLYRLEDIMRMKVL